MNLKMKCKMLGKLAPMSYQWEVSYIEVCTWLGGFDMTWGACGCLWWSYD
jgi:hypothetical protein